MGDRSNIAIVQRDGTSRVYFYAHWAGSRAYRAVQEGLKVGRTDGAYLARNIFHALELGDDSGLSFGISNEIQDNEHAIIVVSPEAGPAEGPNFWDGKQALIWLEDEKGRKLTPVVSSSKFLEIMEKIEGDHPEDDLLIRRMKASSGRPKLTAVK
jgi:hypothetical protein